MWRLHPILWRRNIPHDSVIFYWRGTWWSEHKYFRPSLSPPAPVFSCYQSSFTSASSEMFSIVLAFIDAHRPSHLFPSCSVPGWAGTDSHPQLFMGLSDRVTCDFQRSPQEIKRVCDFHRAARVRQVQEKTKKEKKIYKKKTSFLWLAMALHHITSL